MCLFYSDGMRRYLLDNVVPTWATRGKQTSAERKLLRIFEELLRERYSANGPRGPRERRATTASIIKSRMTPENILGWLNKHDANSFFVSASEAGTVGGRAENYVCPLLSFLGVPKVLFLFMETKTDAAGYHLAKSVMFENNASTSEDVDLIDVDVICIKPILSLHVPSAASHAIRINPDGRVDIQSRKRRKGSRTDIDVNEFRVDSMCFINFNSWSCRNGHEIAGITCNGRRHLYNGWLEGRGYPCALMRYDWLALDTAKDFCLQNCLIVDANGNDLYDDVCFNVKDTEQMYIAIRTGQGKNRQTNVSLNKKKKPTLVLT